MRIILPSKRGWPPGIDRPGILPAITLLGAILSIPVYSSPAQTKTKQEPPALIAPLVQQVPVLDGRLDEVVWSSAAKVTGFIQTEPESGVEATQQTEVFIFYTTKNLYIGARLYDSDASKIVATEYRRDGNLEADDTFEIFLDTFLDRRNAFYFATNPVGARRDALVTNEGDVLNWEWDGLWDVACTRDGDGWTVEAVIPFSTLRFRPGSTEGWGLNLGRLVARSREQSYWAPIDRDLGFNAKWRVSEYGLLQGLTEARAGGRLQLKPYALGGGEQKSSDEPDDSEFRKDFGVDAKIALTSSLVADITVNTDFAQAEADQEQVNLTRFPLFFPEKREFFLENAGLFQVGELIRPFEFPSTLLFFSRRIGLYDDEFEIPILAGARVTGKVGGFDVGAFDIVTRETRIDSETTVPQTNFAALRVKRDILARSSIGVLVLSKTPADEGKSNAVVAADATLAPNANTTIHGFAAKSHTPGLSGSSHAIGIDGGWATDRAGFFGSYVDIGDDFNSEMGFLQRTGIRKYRGNAYLARRPEMVGIRQWGLGVDSTYITDQSGALESQFNSIGPFVVLDDGSFMFGGWNNIAEGLTEPFEIRDGVEIPIGTYRFNQASMQYFGSRTRRISLSGGANWGGFYNGTIRAFNIGVLTRPHRRLSLGADYFRNDVDLPVPGGKFATNLVITRAILAFSPRAYIRGLFQINDEDELAIVNILFRYTYRPGADIFVVYNEERDTSPGLSDPTGRELVVKLTFYFAPF